MIDIARCSQGYLGLVLGFGRVTYPDGTSADAYYGRHLPKVWHRWSSRNPRWIYPKRRR